MEAGNSMSKHSTVSLYKCLQNADFFLEAKLSCLIHNILIKDMNLKKFFRTKFSSKQKLIYQSIVQN